MKAYAEALSIAINKDPKTGCTGEKGLWGWPEERGDRGCALARQEARET
jgi:hypothetical protein